MADKPYRDMDDAELREAHGVWAERVESSPGWSSAYFSAKQLEAICREGERRGMKLTNPYPIRIG